MKKERKIKVIYISGIGRSGSTLLDAVISTNHKVFSVGEIYKYNYLKKENLLCSCGKKFSECFFWQNFLQDNSKIINRMNIKDYLIILNYLYNPFKEKIKFKNKSNNYKLFKRIKESLPKNKEYILDSSKDVARLIEFDNDPRFNLYNITIFRDGRAVANSFNQKTQGPGKNYFISILKWIFINSILRRYQKISNIKTLNVSYDYFSDNPDKEIKRIEDFLKIKIPQDYISVIRKMNYHNIGGNRLGLKKNRRNIKEIKRDQKWETQQNFISKLITTIITWPFNKIWVYKK